MTHKKQEGLTAQLRYISNNVLKDMSLLAHVYKDLDTILSHFKTLKPCRKKRLLKMLIEHVDSK